VYQELLEIKANFVKKSNIEIIPLITSVQDEKNIKKIIKTYKPDTLYHAAAYKHVSYVEENICEGLKNNIFGTLVTAKAAIDEGVSNFVLISTDKAVRPTNIMGASKRIAEICLKALSENLINSKTKFCMVRFGNVFDSSGSVVSKFKKQIKKGGPLTLSHPEITRYFMTVTEAAQLVIQASAMAQGSDVFVLDMGEPIKIRDLARNMIISSGFSVLDDDNPDGDIKIDVVGLKSGEKLYEELLIKNDPKKTEHPKIFKAKDTTISWKELQIELSKLEKLIDQRNIQDILILIEKLVTDFKANRQIKDKLFVEENNLN
jgi:FlaA1/EpsC-like NDP-sugar epimerase